MKAPITKDFALNWFLELGLITKFEKTDKGTVVYFKDGMIGIGQHSSNQSIYIVNLTDTVRRVLDVKKGKWLEQDLSELSA